jgi:hypothetical protein
MELALSGIGQMASRDEQRKSLGFQAGSEEGWRSNDLAISPSI